MPIDSAGWFDWMIKDPCPITPAKVNGGVNTTKMIIPHSAEGYAQHLRELAYWGPDSWGASNMKDGKCYQHYSIYQQTQTSGAAYPNNNGWTNETEGVRGEPLTEPQIDNLVRQIKELSEYKRWTPTRPLSPSDKSATLYEHNECVRWGATYTSCPSGRIPWDTIMERLESDVMKVAGWWIAKPFGIGTWEINLKNDFGSATGYLLGVALQPGTGVVEFRHGDGRIAGVVNARDGTSTFVINPDMNGKAKFNVLSSAVTFQYLAGTPIK